MPTLLALAQANLRIPDDVSVISFDDINGVQLNDHLLSCVKMPQEAMGEIAVNYLRNACTAPKTTPVLRQIMSPALFISESCAKR